MRSFVKIKPSRKFPNLQYLAAVRIHTVTYTYTHTQKNHLNKHQKYMFKIVCKKMIKFYAKALSLYGPVTTRLYLLHYLFKHFNCIFDILKTGFQFSVNLGQNLQCLLKEKYYLS